MTDHANNEATKHNNSDNDNVDEVETDHRVMITLISNDDRAFEVPLEAAKLSGFIVDTLGLDDDDDDNNDDDENDAEKNEDVESSVQEDETNATSTQRRHRKHYEPIIIPRVNAEILQLIIDFLMHYRYVNPMPKIQQPIVGESFRDVMTDAWYQQYVTPKRNNNGTSNNDDDDDDDCHDDDHKNIIFQVLDAANFMEIAPIIDLTCLWCTFQISGKSTEEIRVFLNLPKMTPEEEAKARAEHPWIFESINPS